MKLKYGFSPFVFLEAMESSFEKQAEIGFNPSLLYSMELTL